MTMIERENENISSVNTGCRPKVLLPSNKTESSQSFESCSTSNLACQSNPKTRSSPDSKTHSINHLHEKNPDIDEENKQHNSVPKPTQLPIKARHRPKHVRSLSDCTGLSSTVDRNLPQPSIQRESDVSVTIAQGKTKTDTVTNQNWYSWVSF